MRTLGLLAVVGCALAPAVFASPARPATPEQRLDEAEETVRDVWTKLQRLTADQLPESDDSSRALWHAVRGELAWRTGENLIAAMHLFEALRRPGFSSHEAFPEVEYYLAESLLELGMEGIARPLLVHALTAGVHSRQYKHMLARFLRLPAADAEPARLDGWVDNYRRHWIGRPETDEADQAIRYQLGRVYLGRGRGDVARLLLESIPETDPHYLRARYVLGVALVATNAWAEAALLFEDVARAARTAADRLESARVEAAATREDGRRRPPVIARTTLPAGRGQPVARYVEQLRHPSWSEAAPASPDETRLRAVAQQAALSRARLAMEEEDFEAAWRWYRRVPPGSPHYLEAADGAVWALVRREAFTRAERAADLLIAASPVGLLSGKARLLRAFLVVEAGEFDRADELFAEATAYFELAQPEIAAAGEGLVIDEGGGLAFDQRIAAWSDAEELAAATQNVARLNRRLDELGGARALLATLTEVAADPLRMPAVRNALLRGEALRHRVAATRELAAELRTCSDGCPTRPAGSGGDVAAPTRFRERLDAVEAWVDSLDAHLDRYHAGMLQQARRQAAEVLRVVAEEGARLQGVQAEADTLRAAAVEDARRLAAGAQARAVDLALRAELGMADVAYRSKELVTRRVDELYARKKAHEAEIAREQAKARAAEAEARRVVALPATGDPASSLGEEK